jgi:hypothetical protein
LVVVRASRDGFLKSGSEHRSLIFNQKYDDDAKARSSFQGFP